MTTYKNSIFSILAVSAMAISGQVYAQKAGDLIGYLGGAVFVPKASLGTLTTTSSVPGVGSAVTASLKDATASIDPAYTITLGAFYMWTDNIATELTIGIPPKMTVDVVTPNGSSPTSHPSAATANVMNPSLVAKYLFNSPNDTLRPYAGLGVTYTSFSSVSPNTGDATVKTLAGTSADLSSSWAPIFNLGAIYNIDEKWSINGSISYVPLKTDVTFVGNYAGIAPITTTGTLTLNPWDFVIRLGYKF